VRIKNEELRMKEIDRDRIWRHFSTLFRDSGAAKRIINRVKGPECRS